MRFNLRLLAAIWLPLVVVLGAFAYVSVERERARLSTELERRSWLLGEGLKEAVEPLIDRGPRGQIQRIVERFGSSARGVAVYDRSGTMVAVTSQWAAQLDAPLPAVPLALVDVAPKQGFQTIHNRQTYYYAVPLLSEQPPPRRAGHPLGREPHRPRAVGAGAAAPDPVRRAHRRAEPGHDARGAPQRDASLEPDGGVGASAPGRPGRPAAALVRSRAVRSPGLRGAGPRPKPGPGAGGDRRGGAPPTPGRGGVDRGAAHPVRASPARGAPARRGLEPGAGEPRATRAHDRPADARERRGHRDGAHHAGVRRRLGRPRERRRRPRGGRRARHGAPAAGRAPLRAEAHLALGGGGDRLLLRLRQRRPVAALPHRPRPADLPARGLAPVRRPSTRSSPTRCSRRSPRRTTRPS